MARERADRGEAAGQSSYERYGYQQVSLSREAREAIDGMIIRLVTRNQQLYGKSEAIVETWKEVLEMDAKERGEGPSSADSDHSVPGADSDV